MVTVHRWLSIDLYVAAKGFALCVLVWNVVCMSYNLCTLYCYSSHPLPDIWIPQPSVWSQSIRAKGERHGQVLIPILHSTYSTCQQLLMICCQEPQPRACDGFISSLALHP